MPPAMPKGRSALKQPLEGNKLNAEPQADDSDPADVDGPQADEDEEGEQQASPPQSAAAAERTMQKRKRGRPKKITATAPAAGASDDDDDDELAPDVDQTYHAESENHGANEEGLHGFNATDSAKNGHASDVKKQWPNDAGTAVESSVPRKRGRPRKFDQTPTPTAQQGATAAGSSARKRGRPRKYPDEDSTGRTGGTTPVSKKKAPPRILTPRPSATVQVSAQAEHGNDAEGVYRIMLDISRKVFHDKSVQHVTIRPLNAGEGDALPQGSKIIHLIITDP